MNAGVLALRVVGRVSKSNDLAGEITANTLGVSVARWGVDPNIRECRIAKLDAAEWARRNPMIYTPSTRPARRKAGLQLLDGA